MAQLVEHILGKDEVPGPNPGSSSRQPRREIFGALVFYGLILTMVGAFCLYGVVWSCYSRFESSFRTRSGKNRFAMPPQSASSLLVSDKVSIICLRISESAPDFSLRLGHLRGLTVHRTVIQHPQAASLPRREIFGALAFYGPLLILKVGIKFLGLRIQTQNKNKRHSNGCRLFFYQSILKISS